MPRVRTAILWLVMAFLAVERGSATAAAGWERAELPASGTYAWRYLPIAADLSRPLPVVVFLHGSGSSPESWRPRLEGAAEELGCVLVLPAPIDPFGWGIGRDELALEEALERVGRDIPLDPSRRGLAGHSAGGAYALFLAYETAAGWSGVFAMSAPFRHVLEVADPDYTAPIRFWYGRLDPNFVNGHLTALAAMLEVRGVPWEAEVTSGFGHNDWPPAAIEEGLAFLLAQRYPTRGRLVHRRTALSARGSASVPRSGDPPGRSPR